MYALVRYMEPRLANDPTRIAEAVRCVGPGPA